jgi:DNA-binding response OmpR family regulator
MTAKHIFLDFQNSLLRDLIAEQIGAIEGFCLALKLPADLVITDNGVSGDGPLLVLGRGGTLALPLRLGAVVDHLRYLLSPRLKHAFRNEEPVTLGPFILQPADSLLLHPESGGTIRLTDKERLFLQTLYEAPDHALDRKTLLDMVWDYADGVETHTLETHLYRLRQKLDVCGEATLIESVDGCYRLKI